MLGDVKKAGSTVKVEKNTVMETEKTDEAQQSRKKTMSEVVQEEPSDSPFATSDEEDEAVPPRSTGDVDEDEFRFFEKGKAGDGKAKSKENNKGTAGGKNKCAKSKWALVSSQLHHRSIYWELILTLTLQQHLSSIS